MTPFLQAQVPVGQGEFAMGDAEAFKAKVKHISDFVDIFNYGLDELNSSREEADIMHWQDLRRGAIQYLIHRERALEADSLTFPAHFEAFVRDVIGNGSRMDLGGRDWWAETQFAVLYKGKADTLTLILQKERAANGGLRWVVAGADADFLMIPTQPDSLFVPPNSADTDFLSFREVMRQPGHINAVVPAQYAYDPLSTYFYAQQQGEIEIIYTLQRRLHVLAVPGWCMVLEYEPRDRMNSGWLIYDLFQLSDPLAYKQSMLHLSVDHP